MNNHKLNTLVARIILIVLIILMVPLSKSIHNDNKVIAKINGQKIYASDYLRRLSQQDNEPILKQLVNENLIKSDAKSKGIEISKQEIKDEIKKLEDNLASQNTSLKNELKNRKMTMKDLENQILINKLTSKLVKTDIEVKQEEIDKFISDNKSSLPTGMSDDQLKKSVAEEIKNRSINNKINLWMDSLYKKAKIKYY